MGKILNVFPTQEALRYVLNDDELREEDEYAFYYEVHHRDDQHCMFHRHANGVWFSEGKPSGMCDVELADIGGPANGLYAGFKHERGNWDGCDEYRFYAKSFAVKNDDGTIGFSLYDTDVLAMMWFVQKTGLSVYRCRAVACDMECPEGTVILHHEDGELASVPLLKAWERVCEEHGGTWDEGCPLINSFERLIRKTGMTMKAFADYFGIPYRTVQNWRKSTPCPEWAVPLFEHKLLSDGKL